MGWTMSRADLTAILARIPNIECQGKCHQSCGAIIISRDEQTVIREWCRENGVRFHPLPQKPTAKYLMQALKGECNSCKYLTSDKRCSIHPVRPVICRLFGVVDAMPCTFGCEPPDRILTAEEGQVLLREARNDDLT